MFKAKNYVKVLSLQEAYELNQKKSNALIGGMLWMKMSKRNVGTAIDLSGLELNNIEESKEGFRIGCMCTLRQLELHEGLNMYFDFGMKEMVRHIVGTQFRNSATIGGSVFGRYGFSDILTGLLALDTKVELYHGGMVSLEEFAKMPYNRDILVYIHIKKDGRKLKYCAHRETAADLPVIACAVAKKENQWYISIGARSGRGELVVREIKGLNETNGMSAKDFAKEVAASYSYTSNMRGSAEYRKHLAAVYVRRLVEDLTAGGDMIGN